MILEYLWNFVDRQNVQHVETDVRSSNYCNRNIPQITFVVWDECALHGKKSHWGKEGPAWTKITVIDVEPKGDIGQDLEIFTDLFHSKNQGQHILVTLKYNPIVKIKFFIKDCNTYYVSVLHHITS